MEPAPLPLRSLVFRGWSASIGAQIPCYSWLCFFVATTILPRPISGPLHRSVDMHVHRRRIVCKQVTLPVSM